MRLLRYGPEGRERPAVLLESGECVDVSDRFPDFDRGFLESGGLFELGKALGELSDQSRVELDDVRLGAPIAVPGSLICVGLNYASHAAEQGVEVPSEPVIFTKSPRTVIGPDDSIVLPPGSRHTDWEVELAVVIGKQARYLRDEAEASACVAGYAISNDVSERHWQIERGGQWFKGKSFETFNPLGPWLVTPDEIADLSQLELELTVNDEVMQSAPVSDMVHGVPYLIWYISQFTVLEPGDVINTGTPSGVGLGLSPPRYLEAGDRLELTISGLGRQAHTVVDTRR